MNNLLERYILDRYGFHCEEHSNKNDQAEYGISQEDWENKYPEDVEKFLTRFWNNRSDENKKEIILDCIKETERKIQNQQNLLAELKAVKL